MKVGLIVGHKETAPGACNKTYNICEYQFNNLLAHDIHSELKEKHPAIDVIIIYRKTYKTLPDDVNQLKPDFCISLHCNAFDTKAGGTEVLYYHTSKSGKVLAEILHNKLVAALGLKNRKIQGKSSEDRGGYLLRYTNMPCVISEPFFIDNDMEYKTIVSKYDELVNAYVDSIVHYSSK